MENEKRWESMTIQKPDGTTETTNDYMRVLWYITEDIGEYETIYAIRRALEKYSIFHPRDLENGDWDEYMYELSIEMFNRIGATRKECLMSEVHPAIEKEADEIVAFYNDTFERYMREENGKLKNPFDEMILKEIREVIEAVSDLRNLDSSSMADQVFTQLAEPIRKLLSYNGIQSKKKTVAEAVNIYQKEIYDIVNSETETDDVRRYFRIVTKNGEFAEITLQEVQKLYDQFKKEKYSKEIKAYLHENVDWILDYIIDKNDINEFIEKIMTAFESELVNAYDAAISEYGENHELYESTFEEFEGPINGLFVEFFREKYGKDPA